MVNLKNMDMAIIILFSNRCHNLRYDFIDMSLNIVDPSPNSFVIVLKNISCIYPFLREYCQSPAITNIYSSLFVKQVK